MKEIAPAFSDALTLLRVWANQRGYGDGTRLCVRGFERRGPWWSAVLGLLIEGEEDTGKRVKTKRLGSGLSSYQLFKAVLDFLGKWVRYAANQCPHIFFRTAKHQFEHEPIFLKTLDGHKVILFATLFH
jgi:U3 small nucleolar RNA-associated protein 22